MLFIDKTQIMKDMQYNATLYTTPPGFQLMGVYPGVPPLRGSTTGLFYGALRGSEFGSLRSRYLGGGTAAAVV